MQGVSSVSARSHRALASSTSMMFARSRASYSVENVPPPMVRASGEMVPEAWKFVKVTSVSKAPKTSSSTSSSK